MIFMCAKKVQRGITDTVYGIGDNFKSVEAITHYPRCLYDKCHENTIGIFVGKGILLAHKRHLKRPFKVKL